MGLRPRLLENCYDEKLIDIGLKEPGVVCFVDFVADRNGITTTLPAPVKLVSKIQGHDNPMCVGKKTACDPLNCE
jgi:hypothetical protein